MTRKLRRRLRTIVARAALCALVFAGLGSAGYRQIGPDDDTAQVQAAFASP